MKETLNRYRRFFSENAFWQKLSRVAKQAGVKTVYSGLLLFYAYHRKDTPHWAKHIILGVLGYLVAPIDLIPDISPIVGYTDDIGVLAFGLVTVAAYIDQDVRSKARARLDKWFGEIDEADIQQVEEQL